MSDKITPLAELNNSYPYFEANQLLTSKHLNDLTIYLDVQDRLSRIKLVGIGIACGLEVSYEDDKITISAGTGVTSEGFLITMEEETYDRAKPAVYADPKEYPPFIDPVDTITGQISMRELIPVGEAADDALLLTEGEVTISNKVVVLFLEYNDIDLESCVGQNCDDKGIEREFTVRKLLLECNDVDKIIRDLYELPAITAPSSPSLDSVFNARFDQEYLKMDAFSFMPFGTYKAGFPAEYAKMTDGDYFNERYAALYGGAAIGQLGTLGAYIAQAYERFAPLLGNLVDPGDVLGFTTKFSNQFNSYYANGYIQYFYDYSRDIFKAYNEFVDGIFEITSECGPSTEVFPRHLILGKVTIGAGCPEVEDDCRSEIYRTHFIQSPIYNQQKDKLKEVRNNFKRLIEMIKNLRTDFTLHFNPMDQLKVTPSDEKQHLLEKRSIPYYYNAVPLYKYWNYNYAKKCKAGWNLGYRAGEFGDAVPSSLAPLKYDKDPYNFYRIEGVMGKDYRTVYDDLQELKEQYQLDFEVLPIKMEASTLEELKAIWLARKAAGEENPTGNQSDCGLIDIKEEYLQLRNEIIAEVDKYNWILTKSIYFISNTQELLETFANSGKLEDSMLESENYADLLGLIDEVDLLIQSMPKCVDEFDIELFRSRFKDLQELSFLVFVLTEKFIRAPFAINSPVAPLLGVLFGPILQFTLERFFLINNGFMGGVYDLNNILRSYLDIRMESVHFSYEERMKAKEQRRVFANFLQQNPGLEHKAGVAKGGTFVLVYQKEDTDQTVIADFSLEGKPCCKDEFAFCSEEVEPYAPIAKNVYYFVDNDPDKGPFAEIDVAEFAVDLNVEQVTLSPFSGGPRKSENDVDYEVAYSDTLKRDVIKYYKNQLTADVDSLEFTITNESGKEDTACVFISKMPGSGGSLALLFDWMTSGIDGGGDNGDGDDGDGDGGDGTHDDGTHGDVDGGDVDIDDGGGDGGDLDGDDIFHGGSSVDGSKIPDYSNYGSHGLDLSYVHAGRINDSDNIAFDILRKTEGTFRKVKSLEDGVTDPSPEEFKEFEKESTKTFRDVMQATIDSIKSIDMQIGEPPSGIKENMKYRLAFADKIAARDALVVAYGSQAKALAEFVESNELATDENGDMFKYLDTDFRANNNIVRKHSNKADIAFKEFGKKENLGLKAKELYDSFDYTKL